MGLVIWSCNQSVTIENKKAMKLLNNDDYYFLDVRTFKEHEKIAIPDTDCIPVQEIEKRIEELRKYQDKKLIVYCRSGNRSGIATKILNDNDFNAYNLIGGMNEWKGEIDTDR